MTELGSLHALHDGLAKWRKLFLAPADEPFRSCGVPLFARRLCGDPTLAAICEVLNLSKN
jgi:hypothetical protein